MQGEKKVRREKAVPIVFFLIAATLSLNPIDPH
jgi:hypothetical protein